MAVRADDVDLTRDRSLVELCQAGDEGAFGDLYSRYYQRLLRFCVRRVGNVHEAEEITQEAFARAFSAMPRFAGERRFYPWLTVIASRLCIDSHRRASRAEPAADVDPGSVEGGHEQIIENVDLAYLSQALQQLGPRHREVLELRETHGWTYQQIADHYSVTMGTVEALLFRARKALRREFLAIAGVDGRLAGLPIFGAMLRGIAHLRTRVSDASAQLAPAAAAGAMSVAAVAGGFAFVGSSPSSHGAHSPASTAQQLKTAPVAVVAGGADAAAAPIATQQSADVTSARPASPPSQSAVVATDAGTAHSWTSNDKAQLTIPGLVVATNLYDAAAARKATLGR
jgi:RNA polymerase sigma-70 factor (ECF subfamily)